MTKQSAIETLEIFRNDYTREGSAICRAIDIAIDALRQHTIEPEVRLIDANALHAKIYEDSEHNYGASANIAQVLLRIETAPTIEAKPVRNGRWIQRRNGKYYCSNCEREERFIFQKIYCTKCGAYMREESADNDT
jgi:hypothetical protein